MASKSVPDTCEHCLTRPWLPPKSTWGWLCDECFTAAADAGEKA